MSSGRRAVVGALAAAILVLTTGCGSDGAPDRTAAPVASTSTPSLAFTSPAIGGGTVESTSFAGRPTLLWFWAPW